MIQYELCEKSGVKPAFERVKYGGSLETAENVGSEIKMSRKQLIAEQESDVPLSPCFVDLHLEEDCGGALVGYYKKGGVLMRKW